MYPESALRETILTLHLVPPMHLDSLWIHSWPHLTLHEHESDATWREQRLIKPSLKQTNNTGQSVPPQHTTAHHQVPMGGHDNDRSGFEVAPTFIHMYSGCMYVCMWYVIVVPAVHARTPPSRAEISCCIDATAGYASPCCRSAKCPSRLIEVLEAGAYPVNKKARPYIRSTREREGGERETPAGTMIQESPQRQNTTVTVSGPQKNAPPNFDHRSCPGACLTHNRARYPISNFIIQATARRRKVLMYASGMCAPTPTRAGIHKSEDSNHSCQGETLIYT